MRKHSNQPLRRPAAPEAEIERLTGVFQALGDAARLRILNLLVHGGEVRNTEVEAVTGYGNSKISRHFAYLKHAGLVQDRREGLSVFYSLRPAVGVVTGTVWESMRGWAAYYALFEQDAARLKAERAGGSAGQVQPSEAGSTQPEKPRVLFLCQHNAVRSQMAEALLQQLAGERLDIHSAGLTSTRIHPVTLRVLGEIGIPTKHLRSKAVTEYLGDELLGHEFLGQTAFAYVITLCLEAEEACPRMFPGAAQIVNWPFEDVSRGTLGADERLRMFRLLRDSIHLKLREWLKD